MAQIRTVSASDEVLSRKADVANLFAVHLVRSPAFKASHWHIGERFRSEDVIRMPPTRS